MPPSQVTNAVASRTSGPLSGSTVAATLTNAVGSGNAVYGGCSWDATVVAAITSVTDDKGNSYTVLDNVLDGTNSQRAAQFYRKNITNGPKTVTVTFSGGSPGARTIVLAEFTGVDTADQSNDGHTGQNQQLIGTGANAITSGAITTTLDGDLIVGMSANTTGSPGAPNVGTGFTSGDLDNTSPANCADIRLEYQVQTTHGSVAATFTNTSGTHAFTSLVTALKATSTGINVSLIAATASGADSALAPGVSKTLTGSAGTGAAAAVLPSIATALTAQTSAGAVAAFLPTLAKALTAAAATGTAPAFTLQLSPNLSLTGVAANGAITALTSTLSINFVASSGSSGEGTVSITMSFVASAATANAIAEATVPTNSPALAAIAAAAASEGLLPQLATGLLGETANGDTAALIPSISVALTAVDGTGFVEAFSVSLGIVVALVVVSATGDAVSLTPQILITLSDGTSSAAVEVITANLGGFVQLIAAAANSGSAALSPALSAFFTSVAGTAQAETLTPSLATLIAIAAVTATVTASRLTPSLAIDVGEVSSVAVGNTFVPTVGLNLAAVAGSSLAAAQLVEIFFGLTGVDSSSGVENLSPGQTVVNVPLAAIEALAVAAGLDVIITMNRRLVLAVTNDYAVFTAPVTDIMPSASETDDSSVDTTSTSIEP